MKRVVLCLLFFLASCSASTSRHNLYIIGRDPSWFPMQFKQMAFNINGFTNALVHNLAAVEKIPLEIVDVSWSQLFLDLKEEKYGSIFTSLSPNDINQEIYTFSHPFLLTGPVLVVPQASEVHSLAGLNDGTIGVYQYDESVLIAQRYPTLLIKLYQSVIEALEAIASGQLDGALIPNLEAKALASSLFLDKVKIVTEPLSNKGLRLLTLKGKNEEIVHHFNSGLETVQKTGKYQQLRREFGIE